MPRVQFAGNRGAADEHAVSRHPHARRDQPGRLCGLRQHRPHARCRAAREWSTFAAAWTGSSSKATASSELWERVSARATRSSLRRMIRAFGSRLSITRPPTLPMWSGTGSPRGISGRESKQQIDLEELAQGLAGDQPDVVLRAIRALAEEVADYLREVRSDISCPNSRGKWSTNSSGTDSITKSPCCPAATTRPAKRLTNTWTAGTWRRSCERAFEGRRL